MWPEWPTTGKTGVTPETMYRLNAWASPYCITALAFQGGYHFPEGSHDLSDNS